MDFPITAPPAIKKGDFVLCNTPVVMSYLNTQFGWDPASAGRRYQRARVGKQDRVAPRKCAQQHYVRQGKHQDVISMLSSLPTSGTNWMAPMLLLQ